MISIENRNAILSYDIKELTENTNQKDYSEVVNLNK